MTPPPQKKRKQRHQQSPSAHSALVVVVPTVTKIRLFRRILAEGAEDVVGFNCSSLGLGEVFGYTAAAML